MRVWVGSVSGSYFVGQLASMVALLREYESLGVPFDAPDAMFGSSGGALSSTLVVSGSFRIDSIIDIVERISSSDVFVRRTLPPLISGLFLESAYLPIPDDAKLFELVSPGPFAEIQLVIGAYRTTARNTPCGYAHYFMTKSGPFIGPECRTHLCTSHTVMCNALVASCSIPHVLPPQTVSGEKYSDGGIYAASPLCDFADAMSFLDEPLGLVYFMAVDEYLRGPPIVSTLNSILAANHQKDRETAISIMNTRAAIRKTTVMIEKNKTVRDLMFVDKTKDFLAFVVARGRPIETFSLFSFARGDIKNIIMSPDIVVSVDIYRET